MIPDKLVERFSSMPAASTEPLLHQAMRRIRRGDNPEDVLFATIEALVEDNIRLKKMAEDARINQPLRIQLTDAQVKMIRDAEVENKKPLGKPLHEVWTDDQKEG
jgi:hypothetical protein